MENAPFHKLASHARLIQNFLEDDGFYFKQGEIGQIVEYETPTLVRLRMDSAGYTICVPTQKIEAVD